MSAVPRGMPLAAPRAVELCLAVAGPGPQGCDLSIVEDWPREKWLMILGNRRRALLQELESTESFAIAGARIWVQSRVDFADNRNLVVAAVTLVLGAGDFTIHIGTFALGGIGTATFGAIVLYALLGAGSRAAATRT